MWRGLIADRTSLFFYFLFPLMFLVLFGLLLNDPGSNKIQLAVVGGGPVIDNLPEQVVETERYDDFASAVAAVRDGDIPAAIRQVDDTVEVRYSATDQVTAGMIGGLIDSMVNHTNMAIAGVDPELSVDTAQVEDESFQPIQYLTSGLLAWGIAMSAAFGAAMNLVMWRKNQVLRRLRLAPIHPASIVCARIGVSIVVALLQATLFIQRISWFFPLRYLSAGMLDVLVRDQAAGIIAPTVILLCFAAVLTLVASRFFSWQD